MLLTISNVQNLMKPPKTRCGGLWTEADFTSFIKSALRRATGRWAPKHKCKKDARIARNQYRCALCSHIVGNKDLAIDHIKPVVDPVRGFVSWDEYIARMFCEQDGFRAICKDCHDNVTASQREIRKANKKP